ncbi:MAG: ribosome recycling factor [Planctomycetes bacterium]|nr:ribosome recycling factor [Planctomycetota bacterium]
MTADEMLLDAEERMEGAVTVFRDELRGIRTGRATPGLVDSIRVEYYGSLTPLKQIASIATPEAQLIVIRPFDPSTLKDIEKAILASELGMTPNNDGRVIRLNVPPLSTERRRQLTGRIKELAENARVAIRNVRRDANKHADQALKDKVLTEDDRDQTKEEIQSLTKQYEGQVNELAEKKEAEILEE